MVRGTGRRPCAVTKGTQRLHCPKQAHQACFGLCNPNDSAEVRPPQLYQNLTHSLWFGKMKSIKPQLMNRSSVNVKKIIGYWLTTAEHIGISIIFAGDIPA